MTNRTNANANKKFAIFITSYNYAEFIGQAIESVINQSDPDWHLYIFDNGSTDNTEEIVKKWNPCLNSLGLPIHGDFDVYNRVHGIFSCIG